jgi:hypothetical protein
MNCLLEHECQWGEGRLARQTAMAWISPFFAVTGFLSAISAPSSLMF